MSGLLPCPVCGDLCDARLPRRLTCERCQAADPVIRRCQRCERDLCLACLGEDTCPNERAGKHEVAR